MSSARSYPDHPFIGVSALIRYGNHIVLIERGKEPLVGKWSLPGGAVETGERLHDAIQREIHEEIGLEFVPEKVGELVEILRHDHAGRCKRHFVIAVFISDISAKFSSRPDLQASDDAKDARWVKATDLDQFALTDGTKEVIQRLLSSPEIPLSTS